jgi:hypothetical protein
MEYNSSILSSGTVTWTKDRTQRFTSKSGRGSPSRKADEGIVYFGSMLMKPIVFVCACFFRWSRRFERGDPRGSSGRRMKLRKFGIPSTWFSGDARARFAPTTRLSDTENKSMANDSLFN